MRCERGFPDELPTHVALDLIYIVFGVVILRITTGMSHYSRSTGTRVRI